MASNYRPLLITLPILMLNSVLEVGFVGSMVGFLHDRAGDYFTINTDSGPVNLHGKPKGLLADQGHTSNGAAGTALILVGVLGLLTIFSERRRAAKVCPFIIPLLSISRLTITPRQTHMHTPTYSHSG
jgi:hypothetical protein